MGDSDGFFFINLFVFYSVYTVNICHFRIFVFPNANKRRRGFVG